MSSERSLSSRFIEGLSIFAQKISSQKHIMAIRDDFAAMIPITIIAAFFLLVNNVLLQPENGLLKFIPNVENYLGVGIQVYNATLGIMAILAAFLIGNFLAKSYGMEGRTEGVIAVAAYVVLIPASSHLMSVDGKAFEAGGVLTQEMTSSTGMFLAIIAALVSVTMLAKFSKSKKLKISMPESVPPAIAKSFNILIPSFLVLSILAIIEVLVVSFVSMSIPEIIVKVLQIPLVGGFQTLPGILLYVFLAGFLWVFGIHGAFVLGAISGPVLLTSLQQNIDAVNAGTALPNIVTQPFLDAFVYMGGGGTIICLVIAIFIASKRPDHRMVTKFGLIPSIFNVSEPLMFGLPVVFNPIYGIPLVIAPLASTAMAYFATSWGWISQTYILIPWVTPPVLSGYLATGGDIRASILQIAIIIVGTLIYLPFVLVANRAYVLEQKAAGKVEAETVTNGEV
ncbi:PTS sugar transporter subunit IIC [Listeria monocytogenes]|uniref:PTS sugar transporter subunit IIC n=1 Tax=Listeria monocytogenes TaxID=1639 RepID=UPI000E6D4A64|nr:PTS sugar transporter subunit IIC [Listeria monocytogenes]EDN7522512.1 PTS sugar transporter subunit IIC [Listeria monocytogenes]EDN7545313.1 PTS sugar transporter subunit IIC [Listeria monocytogenes]EDN7583840.1 PTS sugar transporter subunit IIC [Listeria monocytogenes]EDN8609669.1 PTS sugar transporter subunit IIC [Listeria monocytogenes]EDN8621744.1 PTS sugar transporter subunit IIC [Listeria monocytogenes]